MTPGLLGEPPLGPTALVAFLLLGLALVCGLVRAVRGPSLPDRVAALDFVGMVTAGMIVLHGLASDEPLYLRPAIVLALIAFLGTVAFAHYLERRL